MPPIALPASKAHVAARVTRPDQPCRPIDPVEISEIRREEGVVLWVDVLGPDAGAMAMLREEFGFHELALEDVLSRRQRPKIDDYQEYLFILLEAPHDRAGQFETEMLAIFVGRNFVVTCHETAIPCLEVASQSWEKVQELPTRDVGFLVHRIVDEIIDAYFPVVEAIETRLDELEVRMFQRRSRLDPEELLQIKRSLYTLRKAVYPLREVFNRLLRRDISLFTAATYPYFQDIYDHVLRLLDVIDLEREMATGALEAQLSIVSNQLNETMRRLTVVAICVAILGAVFGAWGMNFTHVPLDNLGVLGFAVVSAVALLLSGFSMVVTRRLGLW